MTVETDGWVLTFYNDCDTLDYRIPFVRLSQGALESKVRYFSNMLAGISLSRLSYVLSSGSSTRPFDSIWSTVNCSRLYLGGLSPLLCALSIDFISSSDSSKRAAMRSNVS